MTKRGSQTVGRTPSVESLLSAATEAARARGVPPLQLWNPPFCGNMDIEIRRNGSWFHQGRQITRASLVKLFSSILRRDGGHFFLVTPVEKVGIRVVDAPFLGVEMNVSGEGEAQLLTFRTNVGDVVAAGSEHHLRFEIAGENSELKPYLLVRGRLEALVSRAVMYDLVELGETVEIDGVPMFAVRSGGVVFPVMPAAELDALSR